MCQHGNFICPPGSKEGIPGQWLIRNIHYPFPTERVPDGCPGVFINEALWKKYLNRAVSPDRDTPDAILSQDIKTMLDRGVDSV